MKAHLAPSKPAPLGENPEYAELAHFIAWQLLGISAGGLYAKWDGQAKEATWFLSSERDYVFHQPHADSVVFVEHNRARFRSCIFRLASLCDDGLDGWFAFEWPDGSQRKFTVHSSFYPEDGIGLWIAITATQPPPNQNEHRTT